jgi:hypothetical protein
MGGKDIGMTVSDLENDTNIVNKSKIDWSNFQLTSSIIKFHPRSGIMIDKTKDR